MKLSRPTWVVLLILFSIFAQKAIAFEPPFLTLAEYRKLTKSQQSTYIYALHLSMVKLEEFNESNRNVAANSWLRLILEAANADQDETKSHHRLCMRAGRHWQAQGSECTFPPGMNREFLGRRCDGGRIECGQFYQVPDIFVINTSREANGIICVDANARNSNAECARKFQERPGAVEALRRYLAQQRGNSITEGYERYIKAAQDYCGGAEGAQQTACFSMAAPIARMVGTLPAGTAGAQAPAQVPAPRGSGTTGAPVTPPAARPNTPPAAAHGTSQAQVQGGARGVAVLAQPPPANAAPTAPVASAPDAAPPPPAAPASTPTPSGFCSVAGHIVQARNGSCPDSGDFRRGCPQGQVSCHPMYLPSGETRACVANDGSSTNTCWTRLTPEQKDAIILRSREEASLRGSALRGNVPFSRLRDLANQYCRNQEGAERERCLALASPLVAERERRDQQGAASGQGAPVGAAVPETTVPPSAPTAASVTTDATTQSQGQRPPGGRPPRQPGDRTGGQSAAQPRQNPVTAHRVPPSARPAPASWPGAENTDPEVDRVSRPHFGGDQCDASARFDLLDDIHIPTNLRVQRPVCGVFVDRPASDRRVGGILTLDEVRDLACGEFHAQEPARRQEIEQAVTRGLQDLSNRIRCADLITDPGAKQFYKTHLEAIQKSLQACQRNKPTTRPQFERSPIRVGQNQTTGSVRMINPDHPIARYRDVTVHPQDLAAGLGVVRNHRGTDGATARSIDPCNFVDGTAAPSHPHPSSRSRH